MRRLSALVACVLTACTTAASPETTDTTPVAATAPTSAEPITDVVVLDGDSIRADIGGTVEEIRLLGINAPERDECLSSEARSALIDLVATAGETAVITEERDQFGRVLGYLYLDGSAAGLEMVRGGYAIALASDHPLLPDMLAAEEEAVALEQGVWSPTACGSDGAGREVSIWAIEPDAPGRDDTNPNGEWVALTAVGADVDLSGWMVRDESSVHRYTFPDGFVLADGEIVTVRSGCGEDSRDDLYWCANGTVWNNAGDTVLVLDSFGAVVLRERYRG